MRVRTVSVLAAAVGVLAWVTVAAGEWVSKDGHAHAISSGMHALFIGDDEGGERFDLADLADGETRIFGQGDKQLTAHRTGDEVELSRPARGEESELRITCRVSSDQCSVVTFEDQPEKVMLVVQKNRECSGAPGDCEGEIEMMSGIGTGAHVMLHKIECAGDECNGVDDVRVVADGTDDPHVIKIVRTGAAEQVTLRCPKGDTDMRVAKADADKTYLCPQHSLPLEKVKTRTGSVQVFEAR